VFDPFFTTKAPGDGTGLGLYLCHKFVASFGGALSFDTELGVGTTFHVVLGPAAPVQARTSLEPRRLAIGKLLLIDDDPMVGRALRRMLAEYDVTVVACLDDALRAAQEHSLDAVLCDFMMPGHDGAAVFQALCEAQPSLASRFVFLSGGAFTDHARDFLSSAGRVCLSKPVDKKKLLRALEDCGAPPVRPSRRAPPRAA
jgi:CheY-like chemotaxis protein